MNIRFDHGIYLPDLDLWLDPHRSQQRAVITHAHADHLQTHGVTYATSATGALARLRGRTSRQFHALEYGRPHEIGGAQITLYPAGHILGSAQVLVEYKGQRLLYSGDFKLRPGRSAEPIEVPKADLVVMETTFGRPRYTFPPAEETIERILAFCRDSLAAGCTPVLFSYSLGKGQELLAWLHGLECPIYVHRTHFDMCGFYKGMGATFPAYQVYQPNTRLDGCVFICPSGVRKAQWYQRLAPIRTAYISGWAIDPGCKWRFGVDAAFPLSDHADYPELLEYVERTGADTVYTVHGFTEEFAADLRYRGIYARSLESRKPQLTLF